MTPPRPRILLTRPEQEARRFAAGLDLPEGDIVISPLMRVRTEAAEVPQAGDLILTSANALPAAGELAGRGVWCVGQRLAKVVAEAGGVVRGSAPDAAALVAKLRAVAPEGRLVWLRGADVVRDIAAELKGAGIDTVSVTVYRAEPAPLTAEARDLLAGSAPVVWPLFSPRSAKLAGKAADGARAPLHLIALSAEVDAAWEGPAPVSRHIAPSPDGAAMARALRAVLCDLSP